jgi:cobalt-zinc-cadmium efflux system outer membrane protein
MSTRIIRITVIIAGAIALAGCATVKPQASFPEVQQIASERIGKQVQWTSGSEPDRAVAKRIDEMLAKPLDADSAVQVALLNNHNLQATYEGLGIAQADLVQAGLLKNPVLSGDLKFFDGGTKIELSLVEDFLDVLYIPMKKSIAETALQSTELQVSLVVMDTAADVRTTFLALQSAEQVTDLRRTAFRASEASYELAKRIHDAGNNTKLDLDNERAMYEQSKLNLAAAEAEAIDLREHLTGLMGLWGKQAQFTVSPRLADPPAEEITPAGLEKRAIAQSLDLRRARGEVEIAAKKLGITKPLGVLSELELGAAAERETDGSWGVGPAFTLPIPLFSQGQPAVAAASARLRQAGQRYYAMAVEVRSGVRAAYQHMLAARQRAEYYRQVIIPLRQQITAASQKQYNAMQIGGFQLLQAKREEVEAAKDYIETLREYWLARAELEMILAGRFVRSERPLFAPTIEIKRAQTSGEGQ